MKRNPSHSLLLLLAGALLAGGCRQTTTVVPPPVMTESMASVVSEIDANNLELPSLWARHYYEATIFDEHKKSHFVNGDGVLLYKRPRGMRIVGNKPVAGTVFEIGSTADKYWLKVVPELDTMWWGDYANLGKPCVRPVPIQPDMVFEVLGVSAFNPDFTATPAPVMRYNPDQDVYMFVWIEPATNPPRFVAQKEIWYDRKTRLPKLVLLFDADGRVVLRAFLSKHEPVPIEGEPASRWPKVATDYKLFFPGNGSKISFTLSDMTLCKRGAPCRRGIEFPGTTPDAAGVGRVIQLDEGCGPSQ